MRAAKRGSRIVDADGVRGTVAAFVEQNPNAELSGTPLRQWIEWESAMTVPAYCKRGDRGVWGGAIEMAIASRIWEMSIHVYERASSGSAGSTPSGFRLISALTPPG